MSNKCLTINEFKDKIIEAKKNRKLNAVFITMVKEYSQENELSLKESMWELNSTFEVCFPGEKLPFSSDLSMHVVSCRLRKRQAETAVLHRVFAGVNTKVG